MLNLDPIILALSLALSVLLLILSSRIFKNIWAKIFIVTFQILLFVNSGVALADKHLTVNYPLFHFGFLISLTVAFYIVWRLLVDKFPAASCINAAHATSLSDSNYSQLIISLYLVLCFIPLIYPEWRLGRIFAPGAPDLVSHFFVRFAHQSADVFSKLIFYLTTLLSPFYYIALYRYRDRPSKLFVGLLAPIYLLYVQKQYVGRGTVLVTLLTFTLFYWIYKPKWRRRIVVAAAVALVPLMVALHFWSVVRLGREFEFAGIRESILHIVNAQTTFPLVAGGEVITSGARVPLADYLRWIVTLPIPKIFIGSVDGARINYEMAEIVLGLSPGDKGFTVTLPGVVAESVYVMGQYGFWLHALFLGGVTATVLRILQSKYEYSILLSWFIVFSSYKIVGAGVAALLPVVLNQLLFFYLYVYWGRKQSRSHWLPIK